MKKFLKILNAIYAIAPALLGLFTIYYGIFLAKQWESFMIIIWIIASGFTLMSFTGWEASSKTLDDLETITKRIDTKIDSLIEQKNNNSSINQKIPSNKENQKIMKSQSLIKKERLCTKRNTNNKTTNSKSNR